MLGGATPALGQFGATPFGAMGMETPTPGHLAAMGQVGAGRRGGGIEGLSLLALTSRPSACLGWGRGGPACSRVVALPQRGHPDVQCCS
jgi:hypothetical protein